MLDILLQVLLFNVQTIPKDCQVLILGPLNCGKSVLLKDLLFNKKHCYDNAFAIVNARSQTPEFLEILPHKNVLINEYSSKLNDSIEKNINTLIISHDLRNFPCIEKNVSVFLVSEIISLKICKFDFVFVAYHTDKQFKDKIYKRYLEDFIDYSQFENLLEKTTRNYSFLVINNIEKKIFYYKANLNIPSFQIPHKLEQEKKTENFFVFEPQAELQKTWTQIQDLIVPISYWVFKCQITEKLLVTETAENLMKNFLIFQMVENNKK